MLTESLPQERPPVHSPPICCDHLHADRLLDDLAQLAAAIFSEHYGLCWSDAWSVALAQQGELLQFAAAWDADAARQAVQGEEIIPDSYYRSYEPARCRCGEPITAEDYRLGGVAEVVDASGAHALIHYDSCLRPGDQLA